MRAGSYQRVRTSFRFPLMLQAVTVARTLRHRFDHEPQSDDRGGAAEQAFDVDAQPALASAQLELVALLARLEQPRLERAFELGGERVIRRQLVAPLERGDHDALSLAVGFVEQELVGTELRVSFGGLRAPLAPLGARALRLPSLAAAAAS